MPTHTLHLLVATVFGLALIPGFMVALLSTRLETAAVEWRTA
jgi:hypothetical protein